MVDEVKKTEEEVVDTEAVEMSPEDSLIESLLVPESQAVMAEEAQVEAEAQASCLKL